VIKATPHRSIRIGFIAAVLVLFATTLATYALTTRLIAVRDAQFETQYSTQRLGQLHTAVSTVESGLRGYLLTGDVSDRRSYEEAASTIERLLPELAWLTSDDASQAARLARLQEVLRGRLGQAADAILLYDADEPAAAIRLLRSQQASETEAELRTLLTALLEREREQMDEQMRAAAVLAQHALQAIPLLSILAILLLSAAYVFIRRSLAERDRSLQAIQRSEGRFHAFMENSPVAAFVKDEEGHYWYVNGVMTAKHGIAPEAILGRTDFDWMPAEFAARSAATDRHVAETSTRIESYECEPLPDGSTREWLVMKFPMIEGERRLIGGVAVDVTEQRRAEAALQRNHALVENSAEMVTVIDAEGVIQFESPAVERVLGYAPSELVGRHFTEFVHPDDLPEVLPALSTVLAEPDRLHSYCIQFRHKDGSWRVLEGVGQNLLENPAVRGIVANSRDVTDRRQIQAQLRESEERFRGLAAAAVESTIVHERGVILDANEGAARMFGWSVDELRGRNILDFAAAESHATVLQSLLTGTEEAYEAVGVRRDGSRFPAELQGRALRWQGRPARVTTIRDITARKAAEEALARSEAYYRSLIENSQDLVALIDAQGVIRYLSPAVLHVLGFAPEELIGRHVIELIHPSDIETVQAVFEYQLTDPGVVSAVRYRCRCKDGGWRVLESKGMNRLSDPAVRAVVVNTRDVTDRELMERVLRETNEELTALVESSPLAIVAYDTASQVTLWNEAAEHVFGWTAEEVMGEPVPFVVAEAAEEHRRLHEQVLGGDGFTGVEVARRRKDGSILHLNVSAAPLYDSHGEIRGIMSVNEDITERVGIRRQLQAYARELERSNRELQDFAYVASHDLQEPLRKIQTFGDRLAQRCAVELDEQGRDYVARMQNAAARMRSLIQDLLAFSRVSSQALPPQRLDLAVVAGEVIDDLQARIEGEGGAVTLGPLASVDADPLQMRQLLQNLIGNALKFRRPGVPPVVRLYSEVRDGETVLYVADNGIGFDIRYLDRIFSPFQRLHGRNDYDGTGMGLAICRKIVERHGGEITARSTPGEGSTFIVTLPTRSQTAADSAVAA
jgi:PAS domain S-box-containing protein